MRRKYFGLAIAALATLGPMQAWGGDREIAQQIIKRLKTGSEVGLGLRPSTSPSLGSNARAMPRVIAVIRLTQRICIGVIGNVIPNSKATTMVMASPALVGNVQLMTFLMLS